MERVKGIHFHVIFVFFGQQPSPPDVMRKEFGREVFSRWNKLHGGQLERNANRMTLQKKDLWCIQYLLKGIDPSGKSMAREVHWHGVHNRRLIKANSCPVDGKELVTKFR